MSEETVAQIDWPHCLLYQIFHLDLFQNNDCTLNLAIQARLAADILKSLEQLFSV